MTSRETAAERPALIPRPARLAWQPGAFRPTPAAVLRADGVAADAARLLAAQLADAGARPLPVAGGPARAGDIVLRLDPATHVSGDEGYRLAVTPEGALLQAAHPAGLFYAGQALCGLCVPEGGLFPAVEIVDAPRFPWRGLMLDVARHYFDLAFLRRMIDLLARCRMNRLHLHLVDGQAWTLELDSLPRATAHNGGNGPGRPRRGVYPRDEMRALVAYAAERQVTIVPEIEFPAHADALLRGHPELLCASHPARHGGEDVAREFCPGREDVYAAITAVLAEVAEIFPGPYLHIGGDEYHGSAWDDCPDCRRRVADAGLEAEDTPELRRLFAHPQGSPRKYLLYRYLMRRVAGIVTALGKTPILWDDLSWRGEYPAGSAVMQWHYDGLFDWMHQTTTPEDPAALAIRAGHPVIAAPASHCYFDYLDGGALLRRLYGFEPVPADLSAAEAPALLGPHACLWECPQERVDGMLFPRLLALAEVGWTPAPERDWDDFRDRLRQQLPDLARRGVAGAPWRDNPAPSVLALAWDYPHPAWMKEWWLNELLDAPATLAVALRVTRGADDTAIDRVFLTVDGHEHPLARLDDTGDVARQYIIRLDPRPTSLYSLRIYFDGAQAAGSRGEVRVRRQED